MNISEFLETFPTPLHYNKQPESRFDPWVFWSKNEGSEKNSSSSDSDVGTPLDTIHDKIKSAISDLNSHLQYFICQFWAPVTIDGRRLLSTSCQPFAVTHLCNELAMYRLDCEKYYYDIDTNKLDIEEGDPKIRSTGGPATVFLNRLSYWGHLLESESCFGLKSRIMLPICFPSQTDCIGVLEITSFTDRYWSYYGSFILHALQELKEADLDVCNVQDLIPYKTINGLRHAKDEIKRALEIVCESHYLRLAQVWIAFEDKSHVPLSSYLEDNRRIVGLKLTGYLHAEFDTSEYGIFYACDTLCDVYPLQTGEEDALKTLQDSKPRYISTLRDELLLDWEDYDYNFCAFAICLRSINTSDCNFVFEFIWVKHSECDILLEAILLTLKRCLPSFKFASGAELDDELDVIDVKGSTDSQTRNIKIFKGKRFSPVSKALEEGKQPIVVDNIEPREVLPSEDMNLIKISEFLERFPTPLHHNQPKSRFDPWVFWSKNEGSEKNSSSSDSDVGTPLDTIHDKIKSAFSDLINFRYFICQFWAPVTINGRKLLSTSGQPFAVSHLCNELAMYRLDCEKYYYDIDVSNLDLDIEEGDPKIRSGGPATVFLNRLSYAARLLKSESCFGVKFRIMLPICFPSQTDCIGVLEITSFTDCYHEWFFLDELRKLKKAGLDVCNVQDRIPYKTINGLRHAKDEIKRSLEIVCESHNLSLAQVWIAFEVKSHVPLSSYLEDNRRISGLKLTGYLHSEFDTDECNNFYEFDSLCNVYPLQTREEDALKTLQDSKPRYISTLHNHLLVDWEYGDYRCSAFAICLRSIDTGDFNFAFEFIWPKHSECAILLESILLTLKRCLPSFKFASGAELDDELDVIDVESSKDRQTRNIKIFKGKRLSLLPKALEEGNQLIVVDNIAPHEVLRSEDIEKDAICVESTMEKTKVKHKTSEIFLTREVIEKQSGKTMKEAAKNLNVSLSTLKRKCKVLGISEWPGPNLVKRRANDSCNIQISTNEANGAIHDPSTVNISNNIVFIKAEYEDDMIKFHLPVSQTTFVTVENEISKKLKLTLGTYKLKYLDEDGDWILLTSDEEMNDCVNSSRKSDRILVRLHVHAG